MKSLSVSKAIVRGAYENGVSLAVGYPGTPATEIIEHASKYDEVKTQWSTNEKVALETAAGASFSGLRTLVAIKQVGMNIASDPFSGLTYAGVNGGLVIVIGDDPNMTKSSNAQDSRHYARIGKTPLFEPANSIEAKEMLGEALRISEEFDCVALIRLTYELVNKTSKVETYERKPIPRKEYKVDPSERIPLPNVSHKHHKFAVQRVNDLTSVSENHPFNYIEWNNKDFGIITSGMCYNYVCEAFPEVSRLKLGFSYPLPDKLVKEFCSEVKDVYVVEELDPFIEQEIKSIEINNEIIGKELFPRTGKFSSELITKKIEKSSSEIAKFQENNYKFTLCPGCPYRGILYTLKKLGIHASGDAGCSIKGGHAPLKTPSTFTCMGGSIGQATGFNLFGNRVNGKQTVAIIGDSAFFHTGINALIDCVHNQNPVTVFILDNHITAMTGQQTHPGIGLNSEGLPAKKISIESLLEAIGVENIQILKETYDLNSIEEKTKKVIKDDSPSVLISKGLCEKLIKSNTKCYGCNELNVELNSGLYCERYSKKISSFGKIYKNTLEIPNWCKEKESRVNVFASVTDACILCEDCKDIDCPAISFNAEKCSVNKEICAGCTLCVQICSEDAIEIKQLNN